MSTKYQFLLILSDSGCMDRYIGFHSRKEAVKEFSHRKNRPCPDGSISDTRLLSGCFTVGDMHADILSKKTKVITEDHYEASDYYYGCEMHQQLGDAWFYQGMQGV